MSTHAIDAVSLSIMSDRLVGITDENISALVRSSFATSSPRSSQASSDTCGSMSRGRLAPMKA